MSEEQQIAGGIPPEMIRLSVGIEDPKDIIADLEHGLSKIPGEAPAKADAGSVEGLTERVAALESEGDLEGRLSALEDALGLK